MTGTDYSFYTLDNADRALFLAFRANNDRYGIVLDGLCAGDSDRTSNMALNTRPTVAPDLLEAAISYAPSVLEYIDFNENDFFMISSCTISLLGLGRDIWPNIRIVFQNIDPVTSWTLLGQAYLASAQNNNQLCN